MERQVTVTVTKTYKLSYDPASAEFIDSKEAFNSVIDSGADEDDMIMNVAHQLDLRGGAGSMLEGIGYVKRKNGPTPPSGYSGIVVEDDDPMPNVEIED